MRISAWGWGWSRQWSDVDDLAWSCCLTRECYQAGVPGGRLDPARNDAGRRTGRPPPARQSMDEPEWILQNWCRPHLPIRLPPGKWPRAPGLLDTTSLEISTMSAGIPDRSTSPAPVDLGGTIPVLGRETRTRRVIDYRCVPVSGPRLPSRRDSAPPPGVNALSTPQSRPMNSGGPYRRHGRPRQRTV